MIYIWPMIIIAETPRLIIREFSEQEREIYFGHFTDERVTRHLPKRTKDERSGLFTLALSQYQITKATGTWGMFNKTNNEFIGSCLLRPFVDEAGVVELGYSMDYKYWGKGIATEMAIAMVAHGFEDENVAQIAAVTTLENTASQRVLEKAGLKREGDIVRNGEKLALFRLTR